MNGTSSATGGIRNVTRKLPRWTARLVAYALLVAAALLLLLRFQLSVGRQMAALEREFGDVEAESFYVGVQARSMLRHLDERLLSCLLDQRPTDREAFFKEADELHAWIRKRQASLHTAEERQVFTQIEAAYDRYRADAKLLLSPPDDLVAAAPLAASHQAVQQKSDPLLKLMDDFVTAQQAAFNTFIQASRETLSSLRQLLNLSVVLLVVSTIALAVVAYRGMIAPLRRVLSQSQAVIERQEKLASLGTLAAGVAHEIRNPLTALKFRLFSLRKALPPEFADHEDATVISAEVNRLEKIVKEFLQFARPSDPEPVRLPAQRLLEEVHALLAGQLEKNSVALHLDSSGPNWIRADGQQIKQVLINLVQNAAESIGRNGTITLRVQAGTEALGGRRGPVAILTVADTGPGIPPEVEKRLFDPFFSTKEGGTGLGLAIAARIVTKHGGVLRYQTRLKHGTVFEIVLPGIDDHDATNPHH